MEDRLTPEGRMSEMIRRAVHTADDAEQLIESGALSPLAMRGEVRKLLTWVRTLDEQWRVLHGETPVVRVTRPPVRA